MLKRGKKVRESLRRVAGANGKIGCLVPRMWDENCEGGEKRRL